VAARKRTLRSLPSGTQEQVELLRQKADEYRERLDALDHTRDELYDLIRSCGGLGVGTALMTRAMDHLYDYAHVSRIKTGKARTASAGENREAEDGCALADL